MTKEQVLYWLNEKDPKKLDELFREARACAVRYVGPKVYLRGLIELSNFCSKNCYYCGLRRGNSALVRYTMSETEVLKAAKSAYELGYGSVVIQAGERQDKEYAFFIETLVRKIKDLSSGELGITLSLGEQDSEVYERWFHAGAHRYLLRIETSNSDFYRRIHPQDHSFEKRLHCLRELREIGYQTGTGVMIGLPGQTLEDLARDIDFFRKEDIGMIGMGPYVPHSDTPLGRKIPGGTGTENLRRAFVMIALTRLALKDVNIAAATALQALNPLGREKGIAAGANVIMPNLTPVSYRCFYELYDNKPCSEEDGEKSRSCLEKRLRLEGFEIGYGEWGDAPHFKAEKAMNGINS